MNSSSDDFNVSSALPNQEPSSAIVVKNVIVLVLGFVINYINGTLIHTFRKHQIFYVNPRYVLFIHLVLNDMIQLTTTISLFVLSYIFYKFNVSLCFFIVTLAVFTTFNTPLNLAVMAVECYIAICLPLQHAWFCTIKRTYMVIGWIWAMSALSILPDVFILLATEPLQFFYSTIFCRRETVFRHPISLKKRDVSYIVFLVSIWLTLFYTYFKIIFAAKAAKETKSDTDATKARNTILLHVFQLLLCMLTYIAHEVKKVMLYWFPKHSAHTLFASYIIIQMLPRIISPIVYGLRDKTFRHHLKRYLLCSVRGNIRPLRPETKHLQT